jgi:hypothetical protein
MFLEKVKAFEIMVQKHERMARGDHGLPKVSPGFAIPYPFMLCGLATTETALWPFQEF